MRNTNPNDYRPQVGAMYRAKGLFMSFRCSYGSGAMVAEFRATRFGPVIGAAVLTNAAIHALVYGE